MSNGYLLRKNNDIYSLKHNDLLFMMQLIISHTRLLFGRETNLAQRLRFLQSTVYPFILGQRLATLVITTELCHAVWLRNYDRFLRNFQSCNLIDYY